LFESNSPMEEDEEDKSPEKKRRLNKEN